MFSRLEARRLLNLPETGPTIGWVGRLSQEKAPELFVEAMQQTNTSAMGCLLGDGPMRPLLEAMIREGPGSVRLCGAVPDARRLMPAFDLIVLSSRTEGTPLVLLEAIDAGIPVVATRVGGVPDLLDDDSGLLIESGDLVGLRQAIMDVIRNPKRAAERARHARTTLRALFDFEAWVNRHEELYRNVMAVRNASDNSHSSGGS
jgi:glycosyltransferase involved in cell wall biosynthesis